MERNKVNDLITDQEMAFAHLVLAGTMTDRKAAKAVGLNPNSAAEIKAKPRVRDYMLGRRPAVEQQLVQQEVESTQLDREKVLDRLWEIAYLSPEMTRGSITGQVKAISMIVAILNLIPDRRAASAEKKPAPTPVKAEIYQAAWLREQKATTTDPQPTSAAQQEDSPVVPAPEPASGSATEVPSAPIQDPVPSQPALAHRVPQADGVAPYVPQSAFVPDTRMPFSLRKNPFSRYR